MPEAALRPEVRSWPVRRSVLAAGLNLSRREGRCEMMQRIYSERSSEEAAKLAWWAQRVQRRNDAGGWTRPGRGLYPHQWSWDSAFISIGLAHLDIRRAARELETPFAHQWPSGKVPHIVFDPRAPAGSYFPGPDYWGYVPGQSDIDIMAICRHPLPDERKRELADAISRVAATCPTRGLEFVLYSRDAVAAPSRTPRFEVNLNAGPEMPYHLSLDPASEPAHWFVLDVSIAREHGLRLAGPPAGEVFARIPRPWLLDALEDSLEWHAEHETLTHFSVLNACRAWRFAEEGVWSSKEAGAKWARPRVEDPDVIDAALEIRGGQTQRLDPSEVRAFVMAVKSRVEHISR